MAIKNNFQIGNTSVREINHIIPYPYRLFGKCEYENPTGSHKDRVYLSIIENLEKEGLLKNGMTLIDFTSGNGGAALARLGKLKNYKIKVVIPSQESPDKIKQIKEYGGDIIKINSKAKLGYIDSEDLLKARLKAGKIGEENNYYFLDQANNPSNRIGCKKIGEEIFEYCSENRIIPDLFVCGIGTGGTISGVAEVLKKKFPDIEIIGVEPYESNTVQAYIKKKEPRHLGHNLSGLGMGAINGNMVLKYIDDVILVKQYEWWEMMEQLREIGYEVGKTSAAAVVAAKKLISERPHHKNIFTIFFDQAKKYETEYSYKKINTSNLNESESDSSFYSIGNFINETKNHNNKVQEESFLPCIKGLLSNLHDNKIEKIHNISRETEYIENYLTKNGINVINIEVHTKTDRSSSQTINEKIITDTTSSTYPTNNSLENIQALASFDFIQHMTDNDILSYMDKLYEILPVGGHFYTIFPSLDIPDSSYIGRINNYVEDSNNNHMTPIYRTEEEIIDLISHSGFSINQLYKVMPNNENGNCHLLNKSSNFFRGCCYLTALQKEFNTIEESILSIKAGKPIIILDHREDEGDFYIACEKATEHNINFMLKGKGVLCISMLPERMKELGITTATMLNMNLNDTRFGMAIDYLPGCVSGVSARDRASTVRAVASHEVDSADFLKNGHVRTLESMPNGLSDRQGHCEASMELAQLAGLYPGGVTCEVLTEEGNMMREKELINLSKKHDIPIIKINQIIRYREMLML